MLYRFSTDDVLLVVKDISEKVKIKGLVLRFKSLDCHKTRGVSWNQLLKVSKEKRRNRAYLIFGSAMASDAKVEQKKKIKFLCSSQHSKKLIWTNDFMSNKFWKKCSTFHAVCVFYDSDGNGVLYDPGLMKYKPVGIYEVFFSLAWIHNLYELKFESI